MARIKAYFKLDLYFFENPKTVDLSHSATVLYIASIAYANRLETDGFVPQAIPRRLIDLADYGDGPTHWQLAEELVKAGLWDEAADGWQIHDFLDHNPSKEERQEQRDEVRERYIPAWLRLAVLARDGYRCRTCGTTESLTIDHVYPFSLGGPTTLENLQTLCRPHNSSKGARV